MLSTKAKIRIARALSIAIVGARSFLGRPSVVEVRRAGVNWRLALNEGIDLALYLGSYQNFSKRVLESWVRPGGLIVDIGANIGAHTLRMADRIGAGGRIVAIEPTDYAFAKLSANAQLNPDLLDRMVLVQAALTDGCTNAARKEFYSRWSLHAQGGGRHRKHFGYLESARGAKFVSLDALLSQLRVVGRISGPVTFVKLDVDGHELEVLRGGRATFTSDRPAVLIEIAPNVQDEVPGRFEDVIGTLESYGYQLENDRSGRPLPMHAAGLRKLIRQGASIDAIARPRQTENHRPTRP
jgi:FkbM family methyltransferase